MRVVLLPLFTEARRETVWKVSGRLGLRVSRKRKAPKIASFRPVVRARETSKWSPFGVSRKSLYELR
jgi:hypothetical protein